MTKARELHEMTFEERKELLAEMRAADNDRTTVAEYYGAIAERNSVAGNADKVIADLIGISQNEMVAMLAMEKHALNQEKARRDSENQEKAIRIAVNAMARHIDKDTQKGVANGKAVLNAAKGKNVYVVSRVDSTKAEVYGMKETEKGKRAYELLGAAHGPKTLERIIAQLPEVSAAVARMPKKYAYKGVSAKRVHDNSSRIETRALNIVMGEGVEIDYALLSEMGATDAQINMAIIELADMYESFKKYRVGQGAVSSEKGSVLSDEEKKERERIKKNIQRSKRRLTLGQIARSYTKGGLGRSDA